MTTNGYLLDRLAQPLAEAGLDRVTVSCDSLQRHRFAEMTRRDAFDKVMAGMEAAHDAGLTPIKINCVVIAGTNEDELVEFAVLRATTGHVVRFIEYMPLDAEQSWERAKVVPSGQILDAIDAVYPLVAGRRPRRARVGLPVRRRRAGRHRRDLVGDRAVLRHVQPAAADRRGPVPRLSVRAGRDRPAGAAARRRAGEELEGLIRGAVWRKWAGHRINHADFVRPDKSMSMIGG